MTRPRNPQPSGDGADPPPVFVALLGAAQWRAEKKGCVALSNKDSILLAKLALDGPQSRLELCELMWPSSTPEQGHANLRSRAYRLHASAGTPFIDIGEQIRLSDLVVVDVLEIAGMDIDALLAAGALLPGVDVGDQNELDHWLATARVRVADMLIDALAERSETMYKDGRLAKALAAARKIVELKPLSEVGWHRLMLAQYLGNDRAAAQETYWRCAAVLRDELGIRPGAQMRELMQTVEAAERAPVARHRPVPASVLRPPVLIGRGEAWQAMWTAWQHGQPFLVVGEPGLGKSRLLEEFCRGVQGIVSERAAPGDEGGAYSVLGRLLLRIERQFAPRISEAGRLELARLRDEFGREARAPADVHLLELAVEEILAAAIEQGLAFVVLDDLHNADAPTLQTLRRVCGRPAVQSLRFGLATRPMRLGGIRVPLDAWTQDSHRLIRIDLKPLTREEVTELLASLMLPSLVDGTLAERVFRHAGGHVLFTLATLHATIISGLDPLAARLPYPSSIQSLLDARLAGLPPSASALLHVAAICGEDLTAERAARMLDCSVLSLAPAWAELEVVDVLRAESFSHDLVHEAALRSVPAGVSQSLHRQLAALLTEDATARPARLAWHWEAGARPLEAGRCWHAAAKVAQRTGQLPEQATCLSNAARCHESAGNAAERFEALIERVESMQLRPGGAAVLEALPEVEVLADTGRRRLRCRLARAEALLGIEQPAAAVEHARLAVEEAGSHPEFQGDAEALHAQALVQCLHFDEALGAERRAVAAAIAQGDRWQTLRALQAGSFVHFCIGQIPEALLRQREAVALAIEVEHRLEAAAGEGHIAALLAVMGDVPGAYEQALRARLLHREIGIDQDSALGSVNERVIGTSAAALGHLDEALDALLAGVSSAGANAGPGALAKARLSLAGLWLTLGRADLARPLLDELQDDGDPARQVQRQWLLAQAAETLGESADRYLAAIAKIGAACADAPLVRSVWFEWSYQGHAAEVIDRLQTVRLDCERLGLSGTARSLRWRELARCLEIPGAKATASGLDHARELELYVEAGLSAKCHPPQVWSTLGQAYARAGAEVDRLRCLDAAKQWLRRALPRVPAEHQDSFVHGNPLHRTLLESESR